MIRSSVSRTLPQQHQQLEQLQLLLLKRKCRLRFVSTTTTTTTAVSSLCRSRKKTIVVALSGGVDSSVAAALTCRRHGQQKETNAIITGLHMTNWNASSQDDDSIAACTGEADWKDAAAVAEHLKIPIQRHSFESTYWNSVFEPFLENIVLYRKMGNPDIDCNKYVKFGALLEHLQRQYNDNDENDNNFQLVTGHYARLWHRNDGENDDDSIPDYLKQAIQTEEDEFLVRHWGCHENNLEQQQQQQHQHQQRPLLPPLLLAAKDTSKDQSYFLAGCDADVFRNVHFPLGDYYKKSKNTTTTTTTTTVRDLAQQFNLPTATKRESMGICFVGKRPFGFAHFIQDYFPVEPTSVVTFIDVDTGAIVGQSSQPAFAYQYTIGQGAKISGASCKYFVVDNKNKTNHHHGGTTSTTTENDNVVTVCAGTHHPALYADTLYIHRKDIHWMARNQWPTSSSSSSNNNNNNHHNGHDKVVVQAQCRIRHLQPLVHCTLTMSKNNNNNNNNDDDHDELVKVEFFGDQNYQTRIPVRGITPGQFACFYAVNGLLCLGGGPIHSRGPSYFELNQPLEFLHPAGHNDLSTRIII